MQKIVDRQLRRAKLSRDNPPTQEQWENFLQIVERHYKSMNDDRTQIERSLELSSEEMVQLQNRLEKQKERVVAVIEALNASLGIVLAGRDSSSTDERTKLLQHASRNLSERIEAAGQSDDATSTVITSIRARFEEFSDEMVALVERAKEYELGARAVDSCREMQTIAAPSEDLIEKAGLKIAGTCRPADLVGGDWWDCADLGDGRSVVVIGDVSGHGVSSAIVTAAARTAFEISITSGSAFSLTNLFTLMNFALHKCARRQYLMTAVGVLYDSNTHQIEVISAGHAPLFILKGDQIKRFGSAGDPLGMTKNLECTTTSKTLDIDEQLILYTDGILESRNPDGDEMGEKRFKNLCSALHQYRSSELRDQIFSTLDRYRGTTVQEDDVTLVVLGR